jgi:hypothetical protein
MYDIFSFVEPRKNAVEIIITFQKIHSRIRLFINQQFSITAHTLPTLTLNQIILMEDSIQMQFFHQLPFILLWFSMVVGMNMRTKLKEAFVDRGRKLTSSNRRPLNRIHTLSELDEIKWDAQRLSSSYVLGETPRISPTHPTIQLMLQRLRENSKPGNRSLNDEYKVALCIEGGGMRGCVSAGASAALSFLGLNDAVDIVYGSSAGAMIGAYFVSRQYSGTQIYYGMSYYYYYYLNVP